MAADPYLIEILVRLRDEASSQLKALQREVAGVKAAGAGRGATGDLQRGFDDLGNSAGDSADEIARHNAETDRLRRTAPQHRTVVQDTARAHTDAAKAVGSHADAQSDLVDAARDGAQVFNKNRQATDDLADSFEKLRKKGDDLSASYERFNGSVRNGEVSIKDARRTYSAFESDFGRLSRAFERGSSDALRFGRAADDVGKKLNNLDLARASGGVEQFVAKASHAFDNVGIKILSLSAQLRGLRLVGIVGFIQQLDTAIVGLAGGLASVAADAAQAAGALGGSLVAGIGQAIPVMGVLLAGLERVKSVFAAVQLSQQIKQQAAFSPGQDASTALQTAESLAAAQNGLTNAYDNVVTAQQRVKQSQVELTQARIDALRNIQDLTLAEKTAAEQQVGAHLSLIQAQQALQQVQASGGSQLELQQAQLAVREARTGVTQANQAVPRARADAARARRLGVSGASSVLSAQQAARQAPIDLANSRFAVQQAQDQLRLAQIQAASPSGSESSTQGQLNYLKSQFSGAQLALFNALSSIESQLKNPNSPVGRIGNAIVAPVAKATQEIAKLLDDPKFMAPFLRLANAISGALGKILDVPAAGRFFTIMANDATKNVPAITSAIQSILSLFSSIAKAAAPALHMLLTDASKFLDRLADTESSVGGQKRLTAEFSLWEKRLENILRLVGAFHGLLKALATDAAPAGNSLIVGFTSSIKSATEWVQTHGPEVRKFFSDATDVLKILGGLFFSLGRTMLAVFNPGTLKAFAQFAQQILLPVLGDVSRAVGAIVTFFLKLFDAIPGGKALLEGLVGGFVALLVINKVADGFLGATRFVRAFWAALKVLKETGSIVSALKTLTDHMNNVRTAAQDASGQVKTLGDESQTAGTKVQTAGDESATAAPKVTKVGDAAKEADGQMVLFGDDTKVAGAEAATAGDEAAIAGPKIATVGTDAAVAGGEMSGLAASETAVVAESTPLIAAAGTMLAALGPLVLAFLALQRLPEFINKLKNGGKDAQLNPHPFTSAAENAAFFPGGGFPKGYTLGMTADQISALEIAFNAKWQAAHPNAGGGLASSSATTRSSAQYNAPGVTSASGGVQGSPSQLINYLMARGFSRNAAAGIAGNIGGQEDTSFAGNIVQGGGTSNVPIPGKGFGLAQWTTSSRQQALVALAKQMHLPASSTAVQYAFIVQEINANPSLKAALNATSSPAAAALLVSNQYEGPAAATANNAGRESAATAYAGQGSNLGQPNQPSAPAGMTAFFNYQTGQFATGTAAQIAGFESEWHKQYGATTPYPKNAYQMAMELNKPTPVGAPTSAGPVPPPAVGSSASGGSYVMGFHTGHPTPVYHHPTYLHLDTTKLFPPFPNNNFTGENDPNKAIALISRFFKSFQTGLDHLKSVGEKMEPVTQQINDFLSYSSRAFDTFFPELQATFQQLVTRITDAGETAGFNVSGSGAVTSRGVTAGDATIVSGDQRITRGYRGHQRILLTRLAQIHKERQLARRIRDPAAQASALTKLNTEYTQTQGLLTGVNDQIASSVGTTYGAEQTRVQDMLTGISNRFGTQDAGLTATQGQYQSLGRLDLLPGVDTQLANSSAGQVTALESALAQAQRMGDKTAVAQITQQIYQLNAAITQYMTQAIQDGISVVQNQAQNDSAKTSMLAGLASVATTQGNFGLAGSLSAASYTNAINSDRNQIAAYSPLLAAAKALGDQGAVDSITNAILALTTDLATNTQSLVDNTAATDDAAASYVQARGQFQTGVYGSLAQVVQTMGQITGNVDLPTLRKIYQASNSSLQGTNDSLSSTLFSDFGVDLRGLDPTQTVAAISGMNLSGMEAGMDPAAANEFQNLIDNILGNTEQLVTNNQQLATLNGQLTQPQSFTSTAFSMFRDAIFTGMGGLTPTYAASLGVVNPSNPGLSGTGAPGQLGGGGVTNIFPLVNPMAPPVDEGTVGQQIAFGMKTPSR